MWFISHEGRESGTSFGDLPSHPQGEAEALMVLSNFTELYILIISRYFLTLIVQMARQRSLDRLFFRHYKMACELGQISRIATSHKYTKIEVVVCTKVNGKFSELTKDGSK